MTIVCFIFNFSFSPLFHINSDDDTDCKRLFEQGKHLSRQDLEVLRADAAAAGGGQWKLDGDEDSNLSFEREMENEARNHVNGVHVNAPTFRGEIMMQSNILPPSAATSSSSTCNPVASTSKTKEEVNDELLYDPDEDERDQKWADAHRALHSAPPAPPPGGPRAQGTVTANQRPLNEWSKLKKRESDATLNCPCCLTLLCLDCQRHALYKTQYRAMFVLNCRIDYAKKLLHRDKEQKRQPFKRSKKQRKNAEESKLGEGMSTTENVEEDKQQLTSESDLYHPVHCSSCNTQVALYDINEVYHFFSVLASH